MRSFTLWIVLAATCTPLLLCIAVCGGCYYLGASQVTRIVEASVKKTLDTDPTVQKHIGKVHTCRTSMLVLMASANSSQRYVFHLNGSKGTGKATVLIPPQKNSGAEVVCYPQTLQMPDGSQYDLTVNNGGGFWDLIRKSSTPSAPH